MPENKMGSMPVGKLLFNMSLPPMISMLAAALYNIVDSIFVAMVSEEALTAVALVFPVQMMMMAVNVGTGVGVTSLISRRLGEKKQEDADSAATHGIVFAVLMWIVFTLFAIFAAGPFLKIFTGTDGSDEIFMMALVYCRIVMIGSLFFTISVAIEKMLQGTGNTFHPMLFNLIGIGVNTVLAPILIMGYLWSPKLGVTGAGCAAVIGQFSGFAVAMYIFIKKKHLIRIKLKGFRLQLHTMRDILAVGAPSIVMQAIMPVLIGSLNKMLFAYTSAVFVLGVYYRISTFVILPAIGLNQGALPIMGYSFGAKNRLRLIAAYKSALKVALIIMAAGTALFWVFPDRIMMMYSASGEALAMGGIALRAISIAWVPGAFVMISIGLFQALAHGGFAMIIAIVRQLGFILPFAWILLTHFGVSATWYSFPIAEIAAFALAALFFRRIYTGEITVLPDGVPVAGTAAEKEGMD